MPPGSAASRGRRRRWRKWARILVEGLALGGVQILLLLASGWFTTGSFESLPLALVGVLSACSYLVVSLIEGFLASSRTGKILSGITAAWLVSGISVLLIVLPSIVFAILAFVIPPRPCGTCVDGNNGRSLAVVAFLLLILADNVWAWMLSTLGGWIGGMVGKRDAPAATI